MSDKIIPSHLAYAKDFTARVAFKRTATAQDGDKILEELQYGSWEPVPHMSDLSLQAQIQEFVDSTGAQLTSVAIHRETLTDTDTEREYYMSAAVMYVPAEEGTNDEAPI